MSPYIHLTESLYPFTNLPYFPHFPDPDKHPFALCIWVQLSSSWCHVAMPISVKDPKKLLLRYLALHCPLVLSTDFTASRQLKSFHCLLPIQSVHPPSVNSWVCLLVLNLNRDFRRLLADNDSFVHAGILHASSPILKIFFPSLLSLQ